MTARPLVRVVAVAASSLALASVAPAARQPAFLYDRHVVFDNSVTPEAYYWARGSAVGPSSLELAGDRLPVAQDTCLSPPNCLKLAWQSARGGDWRVTIGLRKHWGGVDFRGSTLSMWVRAETPVTPLTSPLIYLVDQKGEGSPTIRLTREATIEPGRWVRVSIPFREFTSPVASTRDTTFDPGRLASLTLLQGLDDGERHTLLVDDIRIDDDPPAERTPPPVPSGLEARGFERHVELAWRAIDTPDLLHYRVERSLDGGSFTPVGIQKSGRTRYVDFLGSAGRRAAYRLAAMDIHYNESAPSRPVEAATHRMSDEELLSMVQEAQFRYYWDGAHQASGMALEIQPGEEHLIALGASGFGVMAMIVAAD
jgi:hypothetical protein